MILLITAIFFFVTMIVVYGCYGKIDEIAYQQSLLERKHAELIVTLSSWMNKV